MIVIIFCCCLFSFMVIFSLSPYGSVLGIMLLSVMLSMQYFMSSNYLLGFLWVVVYIGGIVIVFAFSCSFLMINFVVKLLGGFKKMMFLIFLSMVFSCFMYNFMVFFFKVEYLDFFLNIFFLDKCISFLSFYDFGVFWIILLLVFFFWFLLFIFL
uniref:NADH dehydrogenase subunit 6 n=1 Tax=Paratomella rubra TaxID=90914 RepID=A0A1X9WD70_PARRR|nr:NADH dehydrogenase subunit 6 [Paratomella rubra]ARS00878.1 NADH dehydrogenase subunit 6 [Paratomella rubra]